MLADYQPEKENRSPSPKKAVHHKINLKDPKILHEIINALKNQGFSLSHLNNEKDQNSPFQLNSANDKNTQQFGKLKALLADREFEVRKLQEDLAQFKLLSHLEHDKTLRKLREQVQSSKSRHGQQIAKWEAKFEEMTKTYERQCQSFKKETQSRTKQQKQQQINNLKAAHNKQVAQLKQEIANCKKLQAENLNNLRQSYEQKLQEIKEQQEKQVMALNNHFDKQIKKAEEVYQSKVLAVEIQKHAQVKIAEQTKQKVAKNQEKLLTQIGILERQRKDSIQHKDQAEMKLKILQHKFDNQTLEIQKLKQQHNVQLADVVQQFNTLKSTTEDIIESNRLIVLKEAYEKTQSFQKRLRELEELKETMISDCKLNQKTLDLKFERRESRKEDVETIKDFEYKLAIKQKETNELYHFLKLAQLQNQNNDKLYTKIFTSKEKRGSSHRNDRDIYSLLKQSQTTDFRHMLMISRKDTKEKKK